MHHVFIRYQFTKLAHNSYTITHLVINSVIQPHTMSIKSASHNIVGLFGFWQGSLLAGTYQITVQHRGGIRGTHSSSNAYTRAMDIIYCY